jgi:hypothetical protein
VSDRQELSKYVNNPDNVTGLQSNVLKLLLQHSGAKEPKKDP